MTTPATPQNDQLAGPLTPAFDLANPAHRTALADVIDMIGADHMGG